MPTVYRLTFASGKSYIGITTNTIAVRVKQHKNASKLGKSKLPVHLAWRKYGPPEVEVLSTPTIELLGECEIAAIKQYGTLHPQGYNMAYGGYTAPTKNPDVAKKLSKVLTGRTLSDSHKQHISDAHKQRTVYSVGYQHTKEAKEKISATLKGNTYAKGKPKSQETKLKMSISIKAALAKKKSI